MQFQQNVVTLRPKTDWGLVLPQEKFVMNVERKRILASWMLLAVLLPMLVLSSVHVHETSKSLDYECNECVQHHCHGHIAELTTTIHDRVLCQFQTFSFVAAVFLTVFCYNKESKVLYAHRQSDTYLDVCGIPQLRAPPFA